MAGTTWWMVNAEVISWSLVHVWNVFGMNGREGWCAMSMEVWRCMHIYIYISNYICIVSLRASILYPFRSSWTRTLLGGLWNVHNSYETCTTSMQRAQLLWNVRNSYETCATSMIYTSSQTPQNALNDTIPNYIYKYIYMYKYYIFHKWGGTPIAWRFT